MLLLYFEQLVPTNGDRAMHTRPGVRGTVSGAEMATCGTREEKQPEQTSPEKRRAAWWEGKAGAWRMDRMLLWRADKG